MAFLLPALAPLIPGAIDFISDLFVDEEDYDDYDYYDDGYYFDSEDDWW